ncbi:MAG: hypothetical protein AAF141_05570 [Pseudomonadota bacterium]
MRKVVDEPGRTYEDGEGNRYHTTIKRFVATSNQLGGVKRAAGGFEELLPDGRTVQPKGDAYEIFEDGTKLTLVE